MRIISLIAISLLYMWVISKAVLISPILAIILVLAMIVYIKTTIDDIKESKKHDNIKDS